jgi:predicted nucleotidyltransferase
MTIEDIRNAKRDEILRLAAVHGARNVRVFGSVARGEQRAESDIDLLVDLDSGRSLMDLAGLLVDLETLLGGRVDVATEQMLKPRVRNREADYEAPTAVAVGTSGS